MRSLIYLSSRKIKNKFLELVKKPGKLILTLFFIALVIMNLSVESISYAGSRPLSEFYAIVFAFYILSFFTGINKGFSHGGTMFTLADVSFLFMSPVRPAAVLLYGMLGRLGSSLWMGIAFVYQFSLLRSYYPVGVKEMLVAVAGYAAVTFLSQLAGMLVYFFTCGNEAKTATGKRLLYVLIFIFAAFFLPECDFTSFSFTSASYALTKPFMQLIPVAGWVFAIVRGILEGKAAVITAGGTACLIFVAATFVILSRAKHGYYEDVLVSAEKNSELSQEERVAGRRKSVKNLKGTLTSGKGASVFFYKHILENRRAGTTLLSPMSLFYVVLIGVYGFVLKGDVISLFVMSCMLCIHTVLSGRWLRELTMPHIYMVPGSPTKKLFFILPELLPKIISESLIQCVLIAFICRCGVMLTAVLTVSRISFCFLLTAAALFTSKLMREREKSNVFVMLCLFFGMLFSLPSILVASGLLFYGMGTVAAFSAICAVNILIGFAVLFMSRKLLITGD